MRRTVSLEGVFSLPGSSAAVNAGGWTFTGGMLAADADGIAADARVASHARFIADPLERQSLHILAQLERLLAAAGCDAAGDVVRIWQWIRAEYPPDDDYRAGSAWPRFPDPDGYVRNAKQVLRDGRRSSTAIGVRELPVPEAAIALETIAVAGSAAAKTTVCGAVAERGAYSPATRVGDWVFLAGTGATDFQGDWMSSRHMGEPGLVAPEARINPYSWIGSEIETQTDFTLRRISELAQAAGSSLDRAIKADVTLGHPSGYIGFERAWRRWFGDRGPARTVVTGARLVLKGIRVEIAMVLLADDAQARRDDVGADQVGVIGAAPAAVRAGEYVFLSGLLPGDEDGAVAPDLVRSRDGDHARRQAEELFDRAGRVCRAAGTALENVCKVQAFLRDREGLAGLLEAWGSAFPNDPPALSAVGLGGSDPLLLPDAELMVDVIAWVPPGG